MKPNVKNLPLHTFIAALFPLVIIATKYFTVLKPIYLIAPLLYISAISALSFIGSLIVLKNKTAAFIFTTFVLISGFYFYTSIQKLIEILGTEYVKDIICTSVWLVFCIGMLVLIKKIVVHNKATALNNFLNIFLALLLIISFVHTKWSTQKSLQEYKPQEAQEALLINKATPIDTAHLNVYYLLLDECANDAVLTKEFGYSNNFNEQLEKLNFFVCKNAVSSYSETFYSMTATLNLKHVQEGSTPNTYYTNNVVNEVYKSRGYQTATISSFYVSNIGKYKSDAAYSAYNECIYENEFINALLMNTAFRAAYKLLFFKKAIDYHAAALRNSFSLADSLVQNKPANARFLYMHINSPHAPLCVDSLGKSAYTYISTQSDYLHQLQYTQYAVTKLINTILQKENGHCIILVQSDHGVREHSCPIVLSNKMDRFKVVNAFYFPDKAHYKYLDDSMNIVNNFRVIFKYQFNVPFEIIK
jgi:hypothetical protein